MPTYGYRCGQCGHEFEILQRITDPPLDKCPKCAGKLAKMLYPAGVIFKGSGYYKTDYRGAAETAERASSNGAAASSTSESKSETSSETKSEAKSETKAETKSSSKSDSKSEKKTS